MDTGLLFFSVLTIGLASPSQSAQNAVLNSYMKQSGIEANFERLGKHYEQMFSDETRMCVGYSAIAVKIAIDKRISLTWHF